MLFQKYYRRTKVWGQWLVLLREILTIIAFIAAGWWAVYEFNALRSSEKSSLEISKLQKEVDFQPVINVVVSAKSWRSAKGELMIEALATVSNVGQFKEILDLSAMPFRVYPVVFREGLPAAIKSLKSAGVSFLTNADTANLLPNAKQHFRLLYKAPIAATYYVEFKIKLSEKSRQQWANLGVQFESGSFEWFDGVYVEVRS